MKQVWIIGPAYPWKRRPERQDRRQQREVLDQLHQQ
jgi:hypothetical protein